MKKRLAPMIIYVSFFVWYFGFISNQGFPFQYGPYDTKADCEKFRFEFVAQKQSGDRFTESCWESGGIKTQ